MPGGDGTGPQGMGPMTGRAAGFCAGNTAPGFANPAAGRGYGFGMGWGRGRGWYGRGGGGGWRGRYWAAGQPGWGVGGYAAAPAVADEMEMLKNQAGFLKTQLEEIQGRITTLENAPQDKKK